MKNKQHYAHRVHRAVLILKTLNANAISDYLTANGHQITAKKVLRYLKSL